MLQKVALGAARLAPDRIKSIIHGHPLLDKISRRLYGVLMGTRVVTIESGPMAGIKLLTGKHVSHAHIRGTYELEVLKAVDQLVQPGAVCYDLGASIGYISLLMARKARHVYAFEPAPHAIAILNKQAAANNVNNITLVPTPISDSVREVSFSVGDAAYGSGINEHETRFPVLKMQTSTLDLFARDHAPPDFIKIDVEGEEGRVLEGSRGVLTAKRPTIVCELHSVEAAAHSVRVLEECGYRVSRLDGSDFIPGDCIRAGDVQVLCVPR
ncbi:MAG: FkbM family methyltransferase [Acidobacteriota bacterium]|nr:FkbM family methyltransferase [Acidobacteriota bacterium]